MHDSSQHAVPTTDPTELRREADWLHRCVFGNEVPPRVADRYVAAHAHLGIVQGVDVARIVERRLDAEAIEFWLRRRRPDNALTQKLRTLLYLVEIEADYYPLFVRHQGSLWSSLPWLVLCPLRSAFKLCRGHWLARRHHVAA